MTSFINTSVRLMAASFLALSAPSLVNAQIVVNSSFELPASSTDQISTAQTNTIITGWTLFSSTPGSAFTGTAAYGAGSSYDGISTTSDGSQGALLNPIFGYHAESLTSNAAITTVIPLATYTLSADVGIPTGANQGAANTIPDTLAFELVESDGTIFASQTFNTNSFSVGSLSPLSFSYTASALPSDLGQGLQIEFFLQNSSQDSHSAIVIDNVSLTAGGAIPEPSTYAMLFGGFAILGLAVRNSKKLNFNS